MNRRQYLSTAAAGAVSGLCGCLSVLESDVQLAAVVGENYGDQRRTVDVRVLEDDSEVRSSTLTLEPAKRGNGFIVPDAEAVDCDWSSAAGRFAVEARVDDDWHAVDVTEAAETDCAGVSVRLDHRGASAAVQFGVTGCADLATESGLVCSFVDGE